jgi:N-acylneuraminate cytidylyltransferase/CMP-N,N'-diacetyllegionaminic acid synthase
MTIRAEKIVAIVPARGGSKGIPGKNLVELGGRSLLEWTIDAANRSGVIDRVIVSTESEEIFAVARAAGAEVPFLRPVELARDDVHAVHVVFHVLDWLREHERVEPKGIMMLLPTSPLRCPEDIVGAVNLYQSRNATAVISVVDLGKYMTNLRYLRGDELAVVAPEENKNAQRQGLEKLYGVNGSIFIARTASLRSAGTFHVDGALGYVMDMLNSIDVNSNDDLELARRIFETMDPWRQRVEVKP